MHLNEHANRHKKLKFNHTNADICSIPINHTLPSNGAQNKYIKLVQGKTLQDEYPKNQQSVKVSPSIILSYFLDILQKVLQYLNCRSRLINWIQETYTKQNARILINSVLTQRFSAEKRIRQGCPLSPLFLQCKPLLLKSHKTLKLKD